MNQPLVYICPSSWTPFPPPSPSRPSGSSQCTGSEQPVSCIETGVAIYFTYGNIHALMLFSQIIAPSPSPTESKKLFYTSVSLFLSPIQGYHYHLSKFHVYALSSIQFRSVAQSCPTLCDPMNRSTPGLAVHHQLPESTQTHVRWVGDCHPMISSSVVPFSSCPESLPAPESFPMSQLCFLHSPTLTSIHDHWKNHSLD